MHTTNTTNNTDNTDKMNNQNMYKEIVVDISRIRIDNLKKTILEFQRIFNRIINGYTERESDDREKDYNVKFGNVAKKPGYERDVKNYFSNKMNSLVEKYKKKMKNVNIKENNGKHMIFKHWKAITRGIYAESFEDKYFNFDSDLIEADNVTRYDQQSNKILFYLIHEFSTLLRYNQDGFMKTNVSNFLVEFIDRVFLRYNTEHLHINGDIKRFMYVLNSIGFLRETEEQTKHETEGLYEEYVDMDEPATEEDIEKQIDDEEEADALDVDMDEEDMEEGFPSQYDRQADIDLNYEEMIMNEYSTLID